MPKKGYKQTKEHKKNIKNSKKGKRTSINTEFKKGHPQLSYKPALGKHWKLSKKIKKKSSESRRGDKGCNWKGGRTPKNKRIRHGIEFRLWREAVFARDNWTCQKCYIKSGMGKTIILHPHHINNFSKFPELRFDIDNGITFCKKCHRLFHEIYGTYNNNINQIKNFLLRPSKNKITRMRVSGQEYQTIKKNSKKI